MNWPNLLPTMFIKKKMCQILTTTRGLETLKWFFLKSRRNAKRMGGKFNMKYIKGGYVT
jgi:hypothetical protein